MSTAIEFNHIGKQYRLGLVSTGTLSHDLNRWWQTSVLHREDPYLKIGSVNDRTKAADSDYVWALRDIDFRVEQGDVVGIIGKNGAGKSTLLKLLSKVTAPTVGTIRARGRIASLLEVGTGFHGEMTGRENIYLNGAIMGMTRQEITRKLDEIVDFSGCERYLDTPVKRYSSGMTVRLGFAVAAHLDPEILVVDEVLAVGDAEFQKKAIGKMQDISHSHGRTVLFVSHNMGAVRSLCTRGIVLDKGENVFDGGIDESIDYYLSLNDISSHAEIKEAMTFCRPGLEISRVSINGTTQRETRMVYNQKFLEVEIDGFTSEEICCDLFVILKNTNDVPLASLAEGKCKNTQLILPKGTFSIRKTIVMPRFYASGDVVVELKLVEGRSNIIMQIPSASKMTIEGSYEEFAAPLSVRWHGFVGLESINNKDIVNE